jgi:D-3-phosphoglycerate dehydrogenase / 2-oxoglutarate reductase
VEEHPGALAGPDLASALDGVDPPRASAPSPASPATSSRPHVLEAVGAFCIGTNQIDLDACLDRGMPVFNAPYANTRSVVELALGQIILLMRDVPEKSALLHAGEWHKSAPRAREVRGKRLGIVGYGNIGAQLSVLAEALGMVVGYFDVTEKLALGNARPSGPSTSSWVVRRGVRPRGREPQNRNLFGAREFAAMKEGAIFINLSRGFVVDLEALQGGPRERRLRSAAVDVFPEEPRVDGEPFDSPLRGMRTSSSPPISGGAPRRPRRTSPGSSPTRS